MAAEKRKQASGSANSSRGQEAHFHDRSYSDGADPSNAASMHAGANLEAAHITQQSSQPTDETSSSTKASASAPAPTLNLARAYLLAALLCGQLARIQDAAGHVRNAGNIIHFLIHRPGGEGGHGAIQGLHGLSLVDYKQYPHRLVEDEQQLVALYWTCVQLEFEMNSEIGQPPSELLRYQAMIPMPDFDVLRVPRGNDEDTVMADTEMPVGGENGQETGLIGGFKIQTILRGHINSIYNEAFGQKGKPIQEQKHNVNMAVASLRQQFDSVLLGRTALPHTQDSVQTARACSAYWEARSYAVLPVLLRPHQADMDDMAEVVCSMTETIKAYHGLESDRLILPNAFGTAMLQCRYLLLLFAASRALPALAAFVHDVALTELIDRTLLSFQELLMFRGILEAARQVLRTIRARLQSHHVGNAVGIVPELSLYCPPFTTAPGIASGIPTASTMDSFISFPTPNSPHLFPSSAFTSPQQSPSISATSSSPSPRSATFVSGSSRMPFRPETMAALVSATGSGSTSPGNVYPRHPHQEPALPLGSSFPVQAENIPTSTADFDGFVYHLGLSNL
ncbi:hypothetical protein Sste5346_006754 [Sporothrix stenoceras]|uniref:C6 zinc finger domain containing protein n=1 Tax=Sporothrix stenoceras TaxID=5173 RepID=A0ABR3YWZ8_9PEZI